MDHSSAQKIINELELDSKVTEITYEKYYIWPLLKYHIYSNLLKHNSASVVNAKNTISAETQVNRISYIRKITNHFFNLYTFVNSFFKHQLELVKLKKNVTSGNLLFVDVADLLYEDKVYGKQYCKYITPYLEQLTKEYKVTFLNCISNKINTNKDLVPYYFASTSFFTFNKIKKYYSDKFLKKTPRINYDVFNDYIVKYDLKDVINKDNFEEELNSILQYEKLWLQILSITQPNNIFLSCHYGNVNHLGMISASKKLNIKTIEVQHGLSMGTMYYDWSHTENKDNFLPNYYWCWSNADVNSLKSSRFGAKVFEPILGGNLWFTKNVNENIKNDSNIKLEKIISELKPKKIILVTLQHSIPISDILIGAVKSTSSDIFWLIRFHPRDYNDINYRENYIKSISGLANVEYTYTTTANLYPLIQLSNVHITHHSTVAVECISFKVPTILLGNKFQEVFKEYIDTRNFFIANTSADILSYINDHIKINEQTFDYFKLQSNGGLSEEIVSLLSIN